MKIKKLPARQLPSLYRELAVGTSSEFGAFKVGLEIAGRCFYVFVSTGEKKGIYEIEMYSLIEEMCEQIERDEFEIHTDNSENKD